MKRIFLLLFLGSLSLFSQEFPAPFSLITSDYGPRNRGTGYQWHWGIDYAAAMYSPISAVEGGVITKIDKTRQGWYIKSFSEGKYWTYFHMFTDIIPSISSNGIYELRNAKLVNPENEEQYENQNIIIFWANKSQNIASKVLSSKVNWWVNIGSDAAVYILDEAGNRKKTQNSVSQGEIIAASGNSGGVAPHLHLACGTSDTANYDINPLYYVQHPAPDYNIDWALPNTENPLVYYLDGKKESEQTNAKAKVFINSRIGADLEQAELYLFNAGEQNIYDDYHLLKEIKYGGRPLDIMSPGTISQVEGSLNINGVSPERINNDSLGNDNFYFVGFNTKIHKSGPILAALNSEARFNDGLGRMVVRVSNIRSGGEINYFEEGNDVIIDNFRPYVEEVAISDLGDNLKYSANWQYQENNLTLNRQLPGYLLPGGDYKLKIKYSEDMKTAYLKTNEYGNIPLVKTSGNNAREYEAAIKIDNELTEDRIIPLRISGFDLANNYVLNTQDDRIKKLDLNLISRNTVGIMGVNGDEDGIHYLRIEAAPPEILWKDNRHYTYKCALNSIDDCGSAANPFIMRGNNIKFFYRDIGSGIKSITIYKNDIGGEIVRSETNPSQDIYDITSYIGPEEGLSVSFEDGVYAQEVEDNFGRKTVNYFRIDTISPRLEIERINLTDTNFTIIGKYGDESSGMEAFGSYAGSEIVYDFHPDTSVLTTNQYFSGTFQNNSILQELRMSDKAGNYLSNYFGAGNLGNGIMKLSKIYAKGQPCVVTYTSSDCGLKYPVEYPGVTNSVSAGLNAYSEDWVEIFSGLTALKCPSIEINHSPAVSQCEINTVGNTWPGFSFPSENIYITGPLETDETYIKGSGKLLVKLYKLPETLTPQIAAASYSATSLESNNESYSGVSIDNLGPGEIPTLPEQYFNLDEASPLAWRIKVSNMEYSSMSVNVSALPDYFSEEDRLSARILKYSAGAYEDITSGYENNILKGDTISADGVYIPVALKRSFDKIAPSVSFNIDISTKIGGDIYVSSLSAVGFLGKDQAQNFYHISGLKDIYYFLDINPGSECFNTAQDETQPAGSCANYIYKSTFSVLSGLHDLYLSAGDKADNITAPSFYRLCVDKEGPESFIKINNQILSLGSTAYIKRGVDEVSIVSQDKNDAACVSGVKSIKYYLGVSPSDCAEYDIYNPEDESVCKEYDYENNLTIKPGTHTVYYFALDNVGNLGEVKSANFVVSGDSVAPNISLSVNGVDLLDGATAYINPASSITISAYDPQIDGELSGVDIIRYLVDISPEECEEGEEAVNPAFGTCENPIYNGPFSLSSGTHFVYYQAIDKAGNESEVKVNYFEVNNVTGIRIESLNPSSGPIGMPFTLTGSSFGNYIAGKTNVLFNDTTAYLTLWTDTKIQGTVPSIDYVTGLTLPVGAYSVKVQRNVNNIIEESNELSFELTIPQVNSLIPSSGPIGMPFTLTGSSFGNYIAGKTNVLFNDTTAYLTLWTDTKIQGTVPSIDYNTGLTLSTGAYAVKVQRNINGGIVEAQIGDFNLVAPMVNSLTPSSGAIGILFSIDGQNFGNYVSGKTNVLFNDTTAYLTLWTESQIKGTIPGSLTNGNYLVSVERALNNGIQKTSGNSFEVLSPIAQTISPSFGPTGTPFTITGFSFGNYVAGKTNVLFNNTTSYLTLWTDTKIQGTVPGSLPAGICELKVERAFDGYSVFSSTLNFNITTINLQTLSPSSGPIGIPFTLTGFSFGNYIAGKTNVLFNNTTAYLTLWTDTKIQGTVPSIDYVTGLTLSTGAYSVKVQRNVNNIIEESNELAFELTIPQVNSLIPSSGPIGMPFTLTGFSFGNYIAGKTNILFNNTTAYLTLWTDTKIQGNVPSIDYNTGLTLSTGAYAVKVQRNINGGIMESQASDFNLTKPVIEIYPSTISFGGVFTLIGSSFGNYVSGKTNVFLDNATSYLTLWTDTKISGKVPGLTAGEKTLKIQRNLNSGISESEERTITVIYPQINSINPEYGNVGAAFTINGISFGPYESGKTEVLFNDTTAYLTLWSESQIKGLAPNMPANAYQVKARRKSYDGQIALSNEISFNINGGYTPLGIKPKGTAFIEGKIFVAPNPAKTPDEPTFHIETGIADSVEIKIYSLAGELVKKHTIYGSPNITSPEYAYQWKWQDNSASGVYFYMIETRKDAAKIIKKGKFAVIR